MTSRSAKIAIYGATGFTGALVAQLLSARGIDLVIGGRNRKKLGHLAKTLESASARSPAIRVAHSHDERALDAMLEGVRVLVNCAGPFTDVGRPVVEAAVRCGVHYVDTTGEQQFMHTLMTEISAKARDSGVVLMPGAAFEYAVGDCTAWLAAEQGARHLALAYAVRSMGTSQGTKKSIVRALEQPGLAYQRGQLVRRNVGFRTYRLVIGEQPRRAVWFPGGEALTVPLHHPEVETVESCMVVGDMEARLLGSLSPILPLLLRATRPLLDRIINLTPSAPDKGQVKEPRFSILACDPQTGEVYATISGGEPYETTGKLIVETALRLNDTSVVHAGGFTSPATLFDVPEFLSAIGLQWSTSSDFTD